MINTATAIKNAIVSPVREIYARVELLEGSTLIETCNCHDRLISFDIQRIGDTTKFFGFGICHRLNVHLIDSYREINLSTACRARVSYSVDKTTYIYPYPDFWISEVHRDENTNEISVTAYDALYKADLYTIEQVAIQEPQSIYEYANAMATILPNVANRSVFLNFPNADTSPTDTLPIIANFEGTETFREALDDAAEATQSIYYLNNENVLCFKRMSRDGAPDLAITKEDYITLSSKTNRRLSAICRATELEDNITVSLEVSGTTQYVRDNAFWDNRDDIQYLLENALDFVGGFTINQFDCNWRGNFLLEIGDKISLTTKDNDVVYAYIIDDITTYNGAFSQVTCWSYTAEETETDTNPSTLGEKLKQTYAKIDKANQQVDIVAGEMASIRLTAEAITQTVRKLSDEVEGAVAEVSSKVSSEELEIAINNIIDNGVESVTTSTGFKFNEEGLRVSKTESEMETLITEDGLTIYRGNEPVLVADNLGIRAEDLHSTTFLIIGDNSRLENYKENRTGCYYIRKLEEDA
jgi:uncharacterized protein YoxC